METINLVGELRLFAEGNHESSGYLLTRDQAQLLIAELDRLTGAAGVARVGLSFAQLTKDARREVSADTCKNG